MSLLTSDFDYALPQDLIASRPSERRDASRMMVVDRAAGTVSHHMFTEFPSLLKEGDLCVLNDTRVVKARFFSDDRKIEMVRTQQLGERRWKAMVRPGKKMKAGRTVHIGGVEGTVVEVAADGERIIEFERAVDETACGQFALPHYMEREGDAADEERYQTVYAREPGAIAAPTAGLHFTPEMLTVVPHTTLTLHVGVGTFRPVSVERIEDHSMHAERFVVPGDSAGQIASARRVVSVGTTVARVLEHCARDGGKVAAGAGESDIFICPGFEFRVVGALLTNFHLPKSTLLMLVSAFAGRGLTLEAYAEAVRERYRFFSYGDCMVIV